MIAERFQRVLLNPEQELANISYEELKTLVLAYPYAANLRLLLLLKSEQEQHPEYERNLSDAAAYTISRARLYTLVVPSVVPVPESVLELKPIAELQRELAAFTPLPRDEQQEEQAELAAPLPAPAIVPVAPVEAPEMPAEPVATEPAESEPVTIAASPFGAWLEQFHLPLLTTPPKALEEASVEAPPLEPEEVAPSPKAEPAPVAPSAKSQAQQLAERSVTEKEEVLSETLAKLYARQGYRDKAIAMYERLCLAFPEKSASFAAAIEQLKN